MNIFRVDNDPFEAARSLGDKHVVKMVLETAQLLSTAHRVLDGNPVVEKSKSGRKITRYAIPDSRNSILYQATHINHPSAIWVRQTNKNYQWTYDHFLGLISEYNWRYGKVHACATLIEPLFDQPRNILIGDETPIPCAMPTEYIISDDPVENYRVYYREAKQAIHKWSNGMKPDWIHVS